MIGLDTNVIVRYVMQDDALQSPKATRFVESLTADRQGFLAAVTLVELVWVLDSCYGLSRDQIGQAVEGLIRAREFVVERAALVIQALRAYRAGSADFSDCIIERCGAEAGCEQTMTFDRQASKGAGMSLLA
jgi:predicted nucleic-acid-binding protein